MGQVWWSRSLNITIGLDCHATCANCQMGQLLFVTMDHLKFGPWDHFPIGLLTSNNSSSKKEKKTTIHAQVKHWTYIHESTQTKLQISKLHDRFTSQARAYQFSHKAGPAQQKLKHTQIKRKRKKIYMNKSIKYIAKNNITFTRKSNRKV